MVFFWTPCNTLIRNEFSNSKGHDHAGGRGKECTTYIMCVVTTHVIRVLSTHFYVCSETTHVIRVLSTHFYVCCETTRYYVSKK